MEKLSKLPNIGKTVEQKLVEAGIETPEELKRLGSKEAFKRLRLLDSTACFNMLCGLEGAVEDIRWHYLDDSKKQELKDFFNSLK